mgnify:CR=1 FL=1
MAFTAQYSLLICSMANEDVLFMRRAFRLALLGMGKVAPNPLVGCVIVKNGKIIGEGFHQAYGSAHAEVNAIKNASTEVAGSTVYVTLEPCAHYGKTPPCSNLIVKSKIKRVIYSIEDVDIRTKKKAHSFLKSKKKSKSSKSYTFRS